MLYLLDASVLITANNSYYPVDQVPEFWEWLLHQGGMGNVKMPMEMMEEVLEGQNDKDKLIEWLNNNKSALLLPDEVNLVLVQQVVEEGYAPDLDDIEIVTVGRDPFLVAHALAGSKRCVVTTEVSKPKKQRQNRRLPDVCLALGVECCDTFALNRALGFRTAWKSLE